MKPKQKISKLIKHIAEGNYADAKGNVKKIIGAKINDRISGINKLSK
jgi:hypothetical protein